MMKKNSKKIIFIVLAVAVVSPMFVLAQTNATSAPSKIETKVKELFCSRIAEFSLKILQRIKENDNNLSAKKIENQNNFTVYQTEQDIRLKENREKWEINRAEQYAKMENLATTSQKQAIQLFKTAVETAVSARQKTVDEAVKSFRDGVERVITERKTAIETAKNTYRAEVETIIQKAKTDCENNAVSDTVRQTVAAAFQAANKKMRAGIQAIDKVGSKVNTLARTRQQTVEKALQDFKAAVEKARADLKAALKKTE